MNNNFVGRKYFIYLIVGIGIFSSCCGQDTICSSDCPGLPSPCKNYPCPIGQKCQSHNGKPMCHHVCENVTCPKDEYCYSAYPEPDDCDSDESDSEGSNNIPYPVCTNPCVGKQCPEGEKCYLVDGICIDYNPICKVAECQDPCKNTKCPDYTICILENNDATCQNPCLYNNTCPKGRYCCVERDGTVNCLFRIFPFACLDPCRDKCSSCPDGQKCISVPKKVCCINEYCCPEKECVNKDYEE